MSRKSRREFLTPELTPLIDIVFLLLIFFLVSSVFKKQELALLLNLPKSKQGEASESQIEKIAIELGKSKIAFNGKELDLDSLDTELQAAKAKTMVELRVDGGVDYSRLVEILDLLQKYKLENVSLITQKGKK